MTVTINRGARVLFTGDSITEGGRNASDDGDLGSGYPLLVASQYGATHPNDRVEFLNRGVGGNRVRDLRARWDADCLSLEPGVVSIMVGINDTCRRYDSNDATPIADYERDYRHILRSTRDRLGAQLVLIEPYLLPVRPEQSWWREDLDPRISVVRQLAAEFGATLVPVDGLLARAAADSRPEVWCPDGVHPTPAGHALLARAWLAAVDPAS